MTTRTLAFKLFQLACAASLVTAAACNGAPEEERAKTASSLSTPTATTTATDADEEEGANDKILCRADADCDSDERCVEGRCVGLDGDRD